VGTATIGRLARRSRAEAPPNIKPT